MSKKRNDKEFMICLTPKPSPKIFQIIEFSLWPLSGLDINPFDYTMWEVLENKANGSFHPNIGSLKTAIEEVWNKMSEEFIFISYK